VDKCGLPVQIDDPNRGNASGSGHTPIPGRGMVDMIYLNNREWRLAYGLIEARVGRCARFSGAMIIVAVSGNLEPQRTSFPFALYT
jgi:hypothetical protein